jgi:hypothetical protein
MGQGGAIIVGNPGLFLSFITGKKKDENIHACLRFLLVEPAVGIALIGNNVSVYIGKGQTVIAIGAVFIALTGHRTIVPIADISCSPTLSIIHTGLAVVACCIVAFPGNVTKLPEFAVYPGAGTLFFNTASGFLITAIAEFTVGIGLTA